MLIYIFDDDIVEDENNLLNKIEIGIRRGDARVLNQYKEAGRSIYI